MPKIEKIINCETNKKFILKDSNGYIFIPDVIIYLLLDDGNLKVVGADLHDDLPMVGENWTKSSTLLLGWLDNKAFQDYVKLIYEDEENMEYAMQKGLELLQMARKTLPYLKINDNIHISAD